MAENEYEKDYTINILYSSAGAASNAIGPFSSWLLAGFGGGLAFILGNIDSFANYISTSSLRCSIITFIFTLFFGLIDKFIGAIISAGVTSFNSGRDIIKDYNNDNKLNIDYVFGEVEKILIFPIKFLLRPAIRKAKSGDRLAMARFYSILWQVQFIVVFIEFILCILVLKFIVGGLNI